MPGPGNKRKAKAKGKTDPKSPNVDTSSTHTEPAHVQCFTLDDEGITRCDQPATEGYPRPNRCKVHHGQYQILYKKYKDASKVVDEVKQGSELPTQEQINRYTDWHAALEKARWVRKYLEAIRVEKTGREIHQKRFFLKVDDGHRRRLKLLEREMVRAVDVLDALQARAHQLYKDQNALHGMCDPPLPTVEVETDKKSRRTAEEVLKSISDPDAFRDSTFPIPNVRATPTRNAPGVGDEDLINIFLRDQKERMIAILRPFFDLESFANFQEELGSPRPKTGFSKSVLEKQFFVFQQFIRRIVFNQPTLSMKSVEKVSFKDLVLSDDFSMEDLFSFLDLFMRPLELPLRWFKDAVIDALAICRHGTAANVGSMESRFPILGGWIFNRGHTARMSNEAWWYLLTMLQPPGNIENRFVRLCNNFDDIIGYLSFGAFGLVPSPNFCTTYTPDPEESSALRNHLSLSGIIVADMVGVIRPPQMRGPVPTTRRGTKRNCIIWAELQSRAYMFGAVRNERDTFTDAFLNELRTRPDLFQVVLRSETAPGRDVEMFGSGPSNSDALPAMRIREFEALPFPFPPTIPPSTRWKVVRSAFDVLYGAKEESTDIVGYLNELTRGRNGGWFFYFKTFPVTYFVILDTVPYRDKSVLARNVAWAALRAGGYAEGEYTPRKYMSASNKLAEERSEERLGWMPKDAEEE